VASDNRDPDVLVDSAVDTLTDTEVDNVDDSSVVPGVDKVGTAVDISAEKATDTDS